MICGDDKKLENIKTLAKETISPEHFAKLLFLYPDEVVKVFERILPPPDFKIVRGYQVERHWQSISDAERKRRELVFSKIVSSADR